MMLIWIGLALMIGTCAGFVLASLMVAASRGDEAPSHQSAVEPRMRGPHQPKGSAGPTPRPNGQTVATKPNLDVTFSVKGPPDVPQENQP